MYTPKLSNCDRASTTPQKLEGTHRVRRTHAVLLTVMLNFDLSTQNHTTYRISQGHSLYQVWTLWNHSFLSYAADKQTDSKIITTPTNIVGVGNDSLRPPGPQLVGVGRMCDWVRIITQNERSQNLKLGNDIGMIGLSQKWHSFVWIIIHQTQPK